MELHKTRSLSGGGARHGVVATRFNETEMAFIKEASQRAGMKISTWVAVTAIEQAEKILKRKL